MISEGKGKPIEFPETTVDFSQEDDGSCMYVGQTHNVECIGVRYMLSLDAQMMDAGVDAEADGELQVEPSTQGLSLFFLPFFSSFNNICRLL